MKDLLLSTDNTYAEYNQDTGLIEVKDKLSGKVIAIYEKASQLGQVESLVPLRVDDGALLYATPGIIATKLRSYTKHVYTDHLGDLIADLIIEGHKLSKLNKVFSFIPRYAVLSRWIRQYPGFREKIQYAYEARAELLRDQIQENVDDADSLDKDELAGLKLKIDTYKWMAEKDGPKKYSGKHKVEATVQAQVLTIDTGIRREGDPGYNKDHTREIIDSMTQLSPGQVGDKDVTEES